METTTKKSETLFGMSYVDVALFFGFVALAVAVGVWGASKISELSA